MNRDAEAAPPATPPHNRLGLDYRVVPPRKVTTPIVDAHTHVRSAAHAAFFEAAAAYGVTRVWSMSPLDQVEPLRAAWPGRIEFIAVPQWQKFAASDEFRASWLADLSTFRQKGARLCKFWMAPPMREKHGLTLDHPFMQPVIRRALDLGYGFLVHVGDPGVWWRAGGRYADTAKFGTKAGQYPPLERFLEAVAPRPVIAAHMGGCVEDLDFLQSLLDRHPHLRLDTSATKWIVREVARQPEAVRAFVMRNADRILFGTDIVTDDRHDFEHYASRYWTHLHLWETPARGESPIDDPDADGPPRLAGLDLPEAVLMRLYASNAACLAAG